MPPPVLCPNVLAEGFCSASNCIYLHDALSCDACSMVFESPALLQAHMSSPKHQKRVKAPPSFGRCSFCPNVVINCAFSRDWRLHCRGKKHRLQAQKRNQDPAAAEIILPTASTANFCDLCKIPVHGQGQVIHQAGDAHQRRAAFMRYSAAKASAEADKNGIEIQGDGDFGVVDPAAARAGVQATLTIRASSPKATTILLGCRLVSAQNRRETAFVATIIGENRQPTLTQSIDVNISFSQKYLGRFEDRLELSFEDTQLRQTFLITRSLKVVVGDQQAYKNLMPTAPYVPRTKQVSQPIVEVVDGERPPALNAIPYVVRLPLAKIPKPLEALLDSDEPRSLKDKIAGIHNGFIVGPLRSSTYTNHFRNLIWIEEYQMICDMDSYNLSSVPLMADRSSGLFYLDVPGLAEKRPSVIVGDQILVRVHGSTGGRGFNGHVHVVRQASVGLRFHHSFNAIPKGTKFDVQFKMNRIPLRRQHQALATVFLEDRILFPVHAGTSHPTPSITFHNKLIESNAPQTLAVQKIVSRAPGSPPFVIFGPPGTGKTITMVEAIVQVLNTQPAASIFACAPSNSAADLIASRIKACLGEDAKTSLFRFVAPSRHREQIPSELLPHTHHIDGVGFSVPELDIVKGYRVIVSTCLSASFASNIGVERGHFTHIFVDEAGQATEPETMVSIKNMADQRTNIVLSGDPKQLGPIVRSRIARELGLDLSYLERLMMRDVYALPTYNGQSVVKLVKNFRSHRAILQYPNDRFYGGELQPCADPTITNRYLNSDYLPPTGKKFPVVFHSINGKDTREASSPSFFNIEEILQVQEYVKRLKAHRKILTSDEDIGVISPYHAQCVKLRKQLKAIAPKVKVGSVEEFQGQERPVVIISTVRSSTEFVEHDLKFTLGFVASPRRFNVAVTRAKSLLIVIGDPNVLGLDPLWREFLNYVHINGGWVGPDIPWDSEEPVNLAGGYDRLVRDRATFDMEEFIQRMDGLTMSATDGSEGIDANVDRPWVTEE